MAGMSILGVLKSTNTRHLTMSFPAGVNPLEYLNRNWGKIIKGISQTIGVQPYHLAVLGYTLCDAAGKKPHAHLLVYSRKSQKNGCCWKSTPKLREDELVKSFQDDLNINLKITPFFYLVWWLEYIAGDRNMQKPGAVTVRLPIYNEKILRRASGRSLVN